VQDGTGLRDRADLALRRDGDVVVLGLGSLDGDGIVDTPTCHKHSPALAALAAAVRADPPPVPRATVRLRVGPNGDRGVWVDCANVDVKGVLDDGAWLERQAASGVSVALGQRGKEATKAERGWVLAKQLPLRAWGSTWTASGEAVPLFAATSGFSQPGVAVARALVAAVQGAIGSVDGASRWLEVGSGSGQLTVPLISAGADVIAVEPDPIARGALRRTLDAAGLSARDVLAQGAGQATDALRLTLDGCDAILADPPRDGLGPFVDRLAEGRLPGALVYVSCGADALLADAARLVALGYRVTRVVALDAFPWTRHAERVVVFVSRGGDHAAPA
jgi:23S rRNA (uracil1939-C5)-methyltransferase